MESPIANPIIDSFVCGRTVVRVLLRNFSSQKLGNAFLSLDNLKEASKLLFASKNVAYAFNVFPLPTFFNLFHCSESIASHFHT